MVPVKIPVKVKTQNNKELSNQLSHIAYILCERTNYDNKDATLNRIKHYEPIILEGVLRSIEMRYGKRVYQNKIYERVDFIFGDNAYDVNRMISSIRRAKELGGIDASDEGYIRWFKTRIKKGLRAVRSVLKEEKYITIPSEEEAMANPF